MSFEEIEKVKSSDNEQEIEINAVLQEIKVLADEMIPILLERHEIRTKIDELMNDLEETEEKNKLLFEERDELFRRAEDLTGKKIKGEIRMVTEEGEKIFKQKLEDSGQDKETIREISLEENTDAKRAVHF